jgi:hypothetical protein
MIAASNHLPEDKDALKAALLEARAKLSGAEAMCAMISRLAAPLLRPRCSSIRQIAAASIPSGISARRSTRCARLNTPT